jgi:hypothetical protein
MVPRWRLAPLDVAAALVAVAAFVLAAAALQFVFGRDPEKPFRDQQTAILARFAEAPPGSIEFTSELGSVTIRDPARIARFLHLLAEAEPVPRHHSHPEGQVRFRLQDSAATYVLGRDSQAADQYWLELDESPSAARTIKLLQSEELTAWLLQEHILKR